MLRFALFLLLSAQMLYGQSSPKTQPGPPLSDDELAEVLKQLKGYGRCMDQNDQHMDFIKRETELYERERAIAGREVGMANKERDLAVKERDLEKARGDFFEEAYKKATKKRGFRCVLKKLYTFGMGTCK